MNNDILNVNLKLIDDSINIIKTNCYDKLNSNNKELKNVITRLTTDAWISQENQEFVEIMNKYIDKLDTISSFYEQITKDLQKIKIEMEIEMNKKPFIHFE